LGGHDDGFYALWSSGRIYGTFERTVGDARIKGGKKNTAAIGCTHKSEISLLRQGKQPPRKNRGRCAMLSGGGRRAKEGKRREEGGASSVCQEAGFDFIFK